MTPARALSALRKRGLAVEAGDTKVRETLAGDSSLLARILEKLDNTGAIDHSALAHSRAARGVKPSRGSLTNEILIRTAPPVRLATKKVA